MDSDAVETVEVASFADAGSAKCPHCGGALVLKMSLLRGRLCGGCQRRSRLRCGQWEEHQYKWYHCSGDPVIFLRELISGESVWIAYTGAEFATEEEARGFVEHALALLPSEADATAAIEAMLDAKERADMAFEDHLARKKDGDADVVRAAAAAYEVARNAHRAAYDALVRMATGGRKAP